LIDANVEEELDQSKNYTIQMTNLVDDDIPYGRKGMTLQNNLRGASWSVVSLESHNISKHIKDVMTLFRIHYFSLEVRTVGTRKYCMQINAMSLKVCVIICECDSPYHSLFCQLVPK
jgi:hypothetical protein